MNSFIEEEKRLKNLTNLNKEIKVNDNFEESNMMNSTFKSNLKFNSELLNKPFNNKKINENKFNNFENTRFEMSSSSNFFKNELNQNNISVISFSGSINFNKSNEFNSSIIDSQIQRKPFDKLSFNGSVTDRNNPFDFSNCNNINFLKPKFESENNIKNKTNVDYDVNINKEIKDNKELNKLYKNETNEKLETEGNLDLNGNKRRPMNIILDNQMNKNTSFKNSDSIKYVNSAIKQPQSNNTKENKFKLKDNKINTEHNRNNNSISKINDRDNSKIMKKPNNNNETSSKKLKNISSTSQINLQSQSLTKCMEETLFSEKEINRNLPKNHIKEMNLENSEMIDSNFDNISDINKTVLTKNEQSYLKNQSKILSNETLEKAKLFNSQFGKNTPFWIEFFKNINENGESIKSNSSYFKSKDKKAYIKNLIEMVKKDAELYDCTIKDLNAKNEGKNKIKSLLLTEVKLTNQNPFSNESKNKSQNNGIITNSIAEESKNNSLFDEKSKLNYSNVTHDEEYALKSLADADLTVADMEKLIKEDPINEKLAGVLNQYEKLEKKENLKKVEDFSDFKKRCSKNDKYDKFSGKSKNSDSNRISSVVQSAINKFAYPNIDQIKENYKDDFKTKTIDNLKFSMDNFNPFDEVDYDNIELGCLETEDLHRLFEIDKKLNKLDSNRYNKSINTVLFDIQKEFNKDRDIRLKEIEAEYLKKVNKIKNKETNKPSVFDVKKEEKETIKYKDYLREMKLKEHEKWELKKSLYDIDSKIYLMRNEEIPQDRKEKIYEELNFYYESNPEWYEKELNRRIPEDFNFDLADSSLKEFNNDLLNLKRDIEEFEKKNSLEKDNPNSTYENLEIKKKIDIKNQMIENYEKAIGALDEMQKDNLIDMEKVNRLYEKIIDDEKHKDQLDSKLKILIEEKENFDQNLEKLDKMLNEEYEFESYPDEDYNNLNFEELERKAFYEEELE